MKKDVIGRSKLTIPAASATPAPPVGSILGQRGINIMDFCKKFNDITKDIAKGTPVPTTILFYEDRTFTIITKKPPVSYFIKQILGIEKGSQKPGSISIGTITREQCRQIAEKKFDDLTGYTIDDCISIVAGSAKSMGLELID